MKLKTLRILTSLVLFTMLLTSCGQNNDLNKQTSVNNDKRLTIVTSFYPMYIFTKNITKDIEDIVVVNMTEPQTGCLHDYQLKPSDMKILEKAKFFVINGGGMESFMDKVIKQMPDLKVIEASKGIEFIKNGDSVNPHVWVSISGAIQEVKNIGSQLAEFSPEYAAKLKTNTEDYVKKLEAQKEKMNQSLKDIENRDIITFHEAFPYFAKEFNLNIISVVEREPGTEPSPSELSDTINKIKASRVKALFVEPQYSSKAADTISRETGVKVYTLDPMVTGPKDADSEAYIKAMDENLKTLLEALKS